MVRSNTIYLSDNILEINDFENTYSSIQNNIWNLDIGLRSIVHMYLDTDYSNPENPNNLSDLLDIKDYAFFRLHTTLTQYGFLLQIIERYTVVFNQINNRGLSKEDLRREHRRFFNIGGIEVASIVDSTIFNLTSYFDYLSHYICYLFLKNKQTTVYWPKFVNKSRNSKDFPNINLFKNVVPGINKTVVNRLYDFRSDLIHNKMMHYRFGIIDKAQNNEVCIKSIIPEKLTKQFSHILSTDQKNISTIYFIAMLFKQTFDVTESILDELKNEFIGKSLFNRGIMKEKMIAVHVHVKTRTMRLGYMDEWEDYKSKREQIPVIL